MEEITSVRSIFNLYTMNIMKYIIGLCVSAYNIIIKLNVNTIMEYQYKFN